MGRLVCDFVVSREMPADIDSVWRVWTGPTDYGAWFGAVPGSVQLHVRPGGTWRLKLGTSQSGSPEVLSRSYLDVVSRQRLGMSTTFSSGDTVMEIDFTPTDNASRVEIRQISDTPGRQRRRPRRLRDPPRSVCCIPAETMRPAFAVAVAFVAHQRWTDQCSSKTGAPWRHRRPPRR